MQILARLEAKVDRILAGEEAESPEDDPSDLRPGWLTIPQASRATGISRYTLRQACNLGRVSNCYKNGNGRWRIAESEVQAIKEHGLPKIRDACRD